MTQTIDRPLRSTVQSNTGPECCYKPSATNLRVLLVLLHTGTLEIGLSATRHPLPATHQHRLCVLRDCSVCSAIEILKVQAAVWPARCVDLTIPWKVERKQLARCHHLCRHVVGSWELVLAGDIKQGSSEGSRGCACGRVFVLTLPSIRSSLASLLLPRGYHICGLTIKDHSTHQGPQSIASMQNNTPPQPLFAPASQNAQVCFQI